MLSSAYHFTFDLHSATEQTFEDSSIIYDRSEFINSLDIKNFSNKLQIDDVQLSKRQSEILRLAVKGNTIKEIARILNLSQRTVGHYFDTVKNKLNVSSRSELISKVMRFESTNLFTENK